MYASFCRPISASSRIFSPFCYNVMPSVLLLVRPYSLCCPIATYRRPIAAFRRPIAALLRIIVAALLRVLSTHCCIVAHYCRPVTAFVCSPNDIAAMLRDLSSYCCDVAHCIALSLHIVAPLLHLNEFCPAIVA